MTRERRGCVGGPGESQNGGEPIEDECTEVVSDMGRFSIVPEWVLDRVGARAVKLYAILGRYADEDTDECWPKRRTLWKRLGCSERTLDAAVDELVEAGALEKRSRFVDGVQQSNLWRLRFAPPGAASCPTLGAENDTTPGQETRHRTRTKEREPRNERAIVRYRDDFEAAWAQYPKKRAKQDALAAYANRRAEGIPAEDLARAVKHYATECGWELRELQFVMHGSTFFGPHERWRDYVEGVPNDY